MTLAEKIEDILRPAIDVRAPYARQMVVALTMLIGFQPDPAAEAETLRARVAELERVFHLHCDRADTAEARVKELEEALRPPLNSEAKKRLRENAKAEREIGNPMVATAIELLLEWQDRAVRILEREHHD